MFGLTRPLSAVTCLADNLAALSATVAEVNGGLRRRLALDSPDDGQALDDGPASGALPAPARGSRKAGKS